MSALAAECRELLEELCTDTASLEETFAAHASRLVRPGPCCHEKRRPSLLAMLA